MRKGQMLGVLGRAEALQMAAKTGDGPGGGFADGGAAGLPDHGLRQVPVRAEQEGAASAKKQKKVQVKEVKFRPGTEEADYQVKLRNLIRFLD
jgi:translation initiation factor IF-3